MTKPELLLIPQPLAQQLVDYLQTRPYGEVHRLIAGLMSLHAAQVVKQPEPEAQPA